MKEMNPRIEGNRMGIEEKSDSERRKQYTVRRKTSNCKMEATQG
jgi:hypothetical protein